MKIMCAKLNHVNKCVGALVDNELNWHKHVNNVIQTVSVRLLFNDV